MTAPFDYSKASPSALLASAMVFGSNGFIESQESEGQKDLCTSASLPIQKPESWETLQDWGIVKGDKLGDLFFNATLPAGWSLKPSDHSMWSYLHDDRGLKRASVFYKAAFYDRDAFITIDSRFHVSRDYDFEEGLKFYVKDAAMDRVVFKVEPAFFAKVGDDYGVVFQGRFWWRVTGTYSTAKFSNSSPAESLDVSLLSGEQVRDLKNNSEMSRYLYSIEDGAKNLLDSACREFLEGVPVDDKIAVWSEAFDFPAA
jgi:hypothetical protein